MIIRHAQQDFAPCGGRNKWLREDVTARAIMYSDSYMLCENHLARPSF